MIELVAAMGIFGYSRRNIDGVGATLDATPASAVVEI